MLHAAQIEISIPTTGLWFSVHVLCIFGFLPAILSVQMAILLALLALPFRAGGAQRGPT